jgi:ELWxxDGT repeat protein
MLYRFSHTILCLVIFITFGACGGGTTQSGEPGLVFSKSQLQTGEDGGSDSFTIKLQSLPTSSVVVVLQSSDDSEGKVSPIIVSFTPADWETEQTVTVSGVDDDLPDGAVEYQITFIVASGDADYDQLVVQPVSAGNSDDDTPANLVISDADSYDFGEVILGHTSEYTFSITNSGTTPATAVSSSGLVDAFNFKDGFYPGSGGTCGATITDTCSIVVTFSPTAAGQHNDTIAIDYFDGLVDQAANRNITGTGVETALLTFADAPAYDFGVVSIGQTAEHTLTVVKAQGLDASGVAAGALEGIFGFKDGSYPGTGGTCATTISDDCTIVVEFTPNSLRGEAQTLLLDYFDGENTQQAAINLLGAGIADQPELLADINQIEAGGVSHMGRFGQVGNNFYFMGSKPSTGRELWKTDGTVDGTTLVKDITPGETSTRFYPYYADLNGVLYFMADDETNGIELWSSDGTEQGTLAVTDLDFDLHSDLKVMGDEFYFYAASGAETGCELWVSDGTQDGTIKVTNGTFVCDEAEIAVYDDTIYFAADNGVDGLEPWISDGTDAGTFMLKDISVSGGSSPDTFTKINGLLYFIAEHDDTGREPWISDGTPSGTILLKDIWAGANGSIWHTQFVQVGSTVFFIANNGSTQRELWKTDGTLAGTQLVKDINQTNSFYEYKSLTSFNDALYFLGSDGLSGLELWTSDGTEEGTVIVKDIYPGSDSSWGTEIVELNGALYFGARDPDHGHELWGSDGTSDGTVLVKDIFPGELDSDAYPWAVFNNNLLLTADDGPHGFELWMTDGTEAGTVLLKNVNDEQTLNADPLHFTALDGELYFQATNGINGVELWKSDWTAEGTVMLKDINPGFGDSNPSGFTLFNGELYFYANDGVYGFELWKTDGTEAGTVQVRDVAPGPPLSSGSLNAFVLNDNLIFAADDSFNGTELWKTDGTREGTVLIKDIRDSTQSSCSLAEGIIYDGHLFFAANDGIVGSELWKTDGTASGTTLVKDLWPGGSGSPYSGNPFGFVHMNQVLYFVSKQEGSMALWQSDGTESGTTILNTVAEVSWGSSFEVVALNNNLFFRGHSAADDWELWMSDGTPNGTNILVDINPNGASYPNQLFLCGDFVYFYANDGTNGGEVWRTDGTLAGTFMLADISINGNSNASNFNCIDDRLYFTAYDQNTTSGNIWVSDGTSAGTEMIYENPFGAINDTMPNNMVNIDDVLVFSNDDGFEGIEPWLFKPN